MFRIHRLHPHGKEHLFKRAQPPPSEITPADILRFLHTVGLAVITVKLWERRIAEALAEALTSVEAHEA